MTLAVVVTVVAVGLAALIAALKVIAPATKTKVDDEVLDYAEKAEAVVETLKPKQ